MSLVENIARRQHRAIDLLHDIEGMKRRGHSEEDIARKTDLTVEYVRGVIHLLENGEHRLLRGVESGTIPVSVAVQIAMSDEGDVQEALQQAYESGELKGRKLAVAQHLVEQRRRRGKNFGQPDRKPSGKLSPNALIRTYKQDVERKRLLVRKAETARERLLFVIQALRTLFADETLMTLVRKEGLDSLPRNLAARIQGG
jgi:ParB family chromosome partitioning protein